uniref:ATPase AAA-type core domain-containing protein n=1 Tax=viral metagenome TaxID=1070528 RepID=A0A6C0H6X8_9ZZZZ
MCNLKSSFCTKHERQLKQEVQTTTIIRINDRSSLEENVKNKILSLQTSSENKTVILKHYHNMKRLEPNSTEYYKNQIFVDLSLSYPWSKTFDINTFLEGTNVKSFVYYLKTMFDQHIYGMENVKNEIINIVCKLITNPNSKRNNLALCGNAGIGKSKFIKVLAEVLGIPLKIISLGGIKDSSFFLGHGYVYVESGPGKILQNIIDAKISNPIVYFDELDKVSETEHGKDIHSFMSYLTDPTQNTEFTDHYFYGMKFDLSKVFYVFTFNDISKIDKVLLDRLNVIHVNTPSTKEINVILQKYCIPDILNNIGMYKHIEFTPEHIDCIIRTFENNFDKQVSSGIREYYRILEKILLEINKDILLDNFTKNPRLDDESFHHYLNIIKNQANTLQHTNLSHIQHMYV